jgi:hypothetical protein
MKGYKTLTRGVLLAAALSVCAAAAPGTPDTPDAWKVQLKSVPQIKKGKVALYQGTATPSGQHFALDDLSIVQPVAVLVLAKNPEDDLSLQLLKDRWDRAHRTGSTKGTGQVSFAVRTQGEMRILVTAPTPTPYQLLVWSGDEIKLPMRSPFMPVLEYQKRHPGAVGGIGGYALWTFGALLVVVAGLGGALIMVKRGRP